MERDLAVGNGLPLAEDVAVCRVFVPPPTSASNSDRHSQLYACARARDGLLWGDQRNEPMVEKPAQGGSLTLGQLRAALAAKAKEIAEPLRNATVLRSHGRLGPAQRRGEELCAGSRVISWC
jgi:hypothetical protein